MTGTFPNGVASTDWYTSWAAADGSNTSGEWIAWDLGATYTLSKVHVWNFNEGGYVSEGIKTLDIQKWTGTAWENAYTGLAWDKAPPWPGLNYEGFDQLFSTSITTSKIRFTNFEQWDPDNNYGVGVGEVVFYGTAVSVPLTWSGGTNEWSTNPAALNWNAGAAAYKDGNSVLFDNSVGAGSKTVNISGDPVAPASVTFNNTTAGAGTYTLTGAAITGATGLTKDGDGMLIVANANTYTGTTNITAGTLQLGNVEAIPHGPGKANVNVNVDGTLDLYGLSPTINGLGGAGIVTSSEAGDVTLTVGDGDKGGSFSGVIENGSATVALKKIGTNTQTLSGDNTFSGGIVIDAGALAITTGDENLGATSGGITFTGSAKFKVPAEITLNSARTVTLSNSAIVSFVGIPDNSGFEIDFVLTIPGKVTGDGGIDLTSSYGGSVVTLSNTGNDFTGPITIGGAGGYGGYPGWVGSATLKVASLADSASPIKFGNMPRGYPDGSPLMNCFTFDGAVAPLVLNNRWFELTGLSTAANANIVNNNTSAANTLTINTDLQVTTAGEKSLYLQGSNTGNNTFAGKIVDGEEDAVVNLTKADAGKWILSGVNTYSGATSVSGGTLEIGGAGKLGNGNYAGNIAIAAGATFKYNSSAAQTLSGIIGTAATAGILVKDGSGTLTLTKANIYTGATTVSGGKLLLGEGGSMGATAVSVTGTATYGMARTSYGASVQGGSTLSLGSGTTLDLRDGYTNTLGFTSTGALSGADLYFDLGTAADDCDILALTGAASGTGTNMFYFNVLGSSPKMGDHAYTLITAASGLSTGGTFDIGTTLPEYTLTLDAQDGAVYLDVGIRGDTNGDKVVDAADYIAIKTNFGLTGIEASLAKGNVTGAMGAEGTVDWDDLQILMAHFGKTLGGAPAATPEPATLGLLAIGALAMLRRRRAA